MEVLKAATERARLTGDVLSLVAGQPSTPAPAPVLRAIHDVIESEVLGYTEPLGILPLREVIAEYHRAESGVEVTADDVVITTGSSGAFSLIFLVAFDVGDTVAVARPGYPGYRNTLAALGCRVLELDCGPATRFQPTVAMLEALPEPPAGVIIASPANPTGTVIDPHELAAIARWCDEHGSLLISDEIYHGITYGGAEASGRTVGRSAPQSSLPAMLAPSSLRRASGRTVGRSAPQSSLPAMLAPSSLRRTSSAWETSRESVVMGSVSKYFSMTGWRLGWMLVPSRLRPALQRLAANLTVCPPVVSQYAAIAAFSPESIVELDGHVRRYAVNRELLLTGLPELGFRDLAPADGAFYIYADIADRTNDSIRWCANLLEQTGVAIVPGLDFDTARGNQTVRMSFAGATDDIAEAIERLRSF